MADTVYLIDTFSLMFQVFHAIPPMTSPSGLATNAVFGFSRDLVTLLQGHQPTWLICALESTGPGTREALYPEYKAHRSEMPEDLRVQLPLLNDLIRSFRVPIVDCAGWEADDVIATLTAQAVRRGLEVRIVTSDKDARQLIGPSVQLYNLRKNTYLDEAGLLNDWGIRPEQVVDFQSLVGDAVDNVPGVPLVGPKKAAALLQQFQTLDEVLAHANDVSGAKLKENLKQYADQARLSRQLVRLNQELPLDFDWDATRNLKPDVPALQQMFRTLGFRRLVDEIARFSEEAPGVSPSADSSRGRSSLFDEGPPQPGRIPEVPTSADAPGLEPVPLSPGAPRTWTIVETAAEFQEFLGRLREQTRFCLDLETTDLDPRSAQIVGWAFCWIPGQSWYLPVRGPEGSQLLDAELVLQGLRPLLESPRLRLVNQNIKYDLMVLECHGIQVPPDCIDMDPMVGDYLLDAGARSHGLEALIVKYLRQTSIPISDLIGTGRLQKSMADVPVVKVAEYATEDADLTLQLADLIADRLRQQNLWDLYWTLERPLIPILAEMEQYGIRVDTAELQRQSVDLTHRLQELIRDIHAIAGHEFNIDSPKQLQVVLFDELNLPVQRRTKTGASTDQDVLEELAKLHELPARIIEHRHLSKLKGTYVDALPQLVHPRTGRIHTSFNQVVAATGRLSSSEPNLQNIPIRTPEGERIRRAFVASSLAQSHGGRGENRLRVGDSMVDSRVPQRSLFDALEAAPAPQMLLSRTEIAGHEPWQLVCADYSQMELRVLAHFSQDRELIAAFQAGIDIHAAVASQVFGVDPAAVSAEQRRLAKAVNFGVIYGQSAFGLAAALNIDQKEAAEFIDNYFARFSGVSQFIEETLTEAQAKGFVTTIRGRRRQIDGVRAVRNRNLNMPERTAVNTVIQGSAADLIKCAMLAVHHKLRENSHPGRILLQIHDELVLEAPQAQVGSLVEITREAMQSAMELSVPLIVDISAGHNWLETTPV